MRPMLSLLACALGTALGSSWLLSGGLASQAHAAELLPLAPRITGELGYGYDSNVFRQEHAASDGQFVTYYARLGQNLLSVGDGGIGVETRAFGQRYLHGLDDANRGMLVVEGTFGHPLFRLGGKSLRGELNAAYQRQRQVFVSRLTGEEYDIDVDDAEVALGDRFDSQGAVGQFSLHYSDPWKMDWRFEYKLGIKDYANDYEDLPTVSSLDYDHRGFTLWLNRPLWRRVRGGLWFESTRRQYDEYLARDMAGDLVADVSRSFHYRGLHAEVRADLSPRWRATVDAAYTTRKDEFVGYYDYRQWTVNPEVRTEIGRRAILWARYRLLLRDYFHARVDFDADEPLRKDIWHRGEVEARYQLRNPLAFFLMIRSDFQDRREPGYSYDRLRSSFGVRVTFAANNN